MTVFIIFIKTLKNVGHIPVGLIHISNILPRLIGTVILSGLMTKGYTGLHSLITIPHRQNGKCHVVRYPLLRELSTRKVTQEKDYVCLSQES